MASRRPKINAELRRKILVESGHRCTIPQCRNTEVDIHHIIAWSRVKKHEYDNLIALCPICHRRAHKGEIDPKSLRIYKNNLRFAIDKYSQFELDTLFELFELGIAKGVLFPQYLKLLIKRILDHNLVQLEKELPLEYLSGAVSINIDTLVITKKGLQYIKDLREKKDKGY